METSRQAWRLSTCLLLGLLFLATTLQNVQGGEESSEAPSQCKPFIEKALKEQQKDELPPDQESASATDDFELDHDADISDTTNAESIEAHQVEETGASIETEVTDLKSEQESVEQEEVNVEIQNEIETEEQGASDDGDETTEEGAEAKRSKEGDVFLENILSDQHTAEALESQTSVDGQEASEEDAKESIEKTTAEAPSVEDEIDTKETTAESSEGDVVLTESQEQPASIKEPTEEVKTSEEALEESTKLKAESHKKTETEESAESTQDAIESVEAGAETIQAESTESFESGAAEETEEVKSVEAEVESEASISVAEPTEAKETLEVQGNQFPVVLQELEGTAKEAEIDSSLKKVKIEMEDNVKVKGRAHAAQEAPEGTTEKEAKTSNDGEVFESEAAAGESKESVPEEDLILEIEVPDNLRQRDHVDQLLKLDDNNDQSESLLNRLNDVTLKELKKLYENAIKPLETLYKYRDLSNRHFGDSEIFSKPLVLFMGPWSGGKSSIINYLLDNEYNVTSLTSGAEPSPAYFNLVMYGDEPEVLDGTQLAADFTFSGLQKFGQGLEERLRGLKLPNKLLEKINIVEIPGILEVRKQVSRIFPFNDACQWFIDRADIIFLVYDPSKLDVGPETEAILDQLKGREHQTRIVLNKADQVRPEELMRVQSALIWNISPLMSSAQPPVMYTTSLWSRPYETWAPVRLLQAQERAFLRDLRSAVDKRIESKISSARRFAVRVRNHAKMVDCYLTTYYNHKSVFGNKKQVAEQIIEHPQDYHIYEGLSTLTNISRYDLPDPEVYRDFFRLNPLYEFQQLSATCTYFRGCPINRLDVAIAYDLPELVGKHKKLVESALAKVKSNNS